MRKLAYIFCAFSLLCTGASAYAYSGPEEEAVADQSAQSQERQSSFRVRRAVGVIGRGIDGQAKANDEKPAHFKFYGFIRNYFSYDSRDSKAGTKDLFYYLPKDESINANGDDVNAISSFRFLAITTRLGLDVKDYQFGKTKVGAKIETDFYCMNGNVAVLRLRQAYLQASWEGLGRNRTQSASFKLGQTWHPLAADQPYVIDLETGTPFNPFSRTPQAMVDYNLSKKITFTGGILYQMQYLSTGPSGASDNYLKYSCIPEAYAGVTFKSKSGFLGRVGVDVLSIKPRWKDALGSKVQDRLTTANPFVYAQYVHGAFAINGKFVYGSAGEHINLLSGYGLASTDDPDKYEYAPLHSAVSYVSVKYGRKVQVQGMLGWFQNLGTSKSLETDAAGLVSGLYISSNGEKNLKSLVRVTPTVVYNLGKLSFALEYDLTSARYGKGDVSEYGLVNDDLHWITNHRVLGMVKFTF